MSLTIAVAGKGGTGKTTVAALLCRALLDRRMRPLLAVDADPNSCLPERLGLNVERTIGELREELRADTTRVPAGISKREWIENLISQEIAESVGFDVVAMGRQEGPDCYCFINNLLRHCLGKLNENYQAVVIDNEAGLEHLSRRTDGKVDVLLVISQPTPLGARTAERITAIVRNLKLQIGASYAVLNMLDRPPTPEMTAALAAAGLETLGSVPRDPLAEEFELQRKSLLELPAEAPMLRAVDGLLGTILERRRA
jgi:CO dehydrogenase maturation factor